MPVAGPRISDAANAQHAASGKEPQASEPQTWELPSDQVAVGAIPQQPPGFQPRPYLMTQLNRAGPGVSVLTGMQGAGKTQLAAAYARAKLAGGWRLVAWVNAEDAASLLAGLAAVADATGLSDGSPGQKAVDAGQAVRRRFEADGERCLLVLDDARDPDVLRPFVPANGAAQVLITSAQRPLANLGTCVPVDVFSAEEAVAFLAGRTGREDEAGAAEVAAELGYLPLALAQAATVIAERHLRYGAYLERLRALPIEEYLVREDGQPYARGVAKAVLLSLQTVQVADQSGVWTRVMEIAAVLSAAGVRREVLHTAGHAGVLARGGRRSRVSAALVDRALVRLQERSLLTFSLDGQAVIVHRLVMRAVRDGLAGRGRLTAEYRAAASVLDARTRALAGSTDPVAVRDVAGQMLALWENAAESAAEADDELIRVLLSLRLWALCQLNELGDSASEAIAAGEPLVADFERIMGPDHPDTLNSRNHLANAYRKAGRVAEAIPLVEQTLAARERLLGPDHPDTLTSQNNLAAAYRDAGRVAEAIPLFEQTLAACERLLGPDHPRTLKSRSNLTAAYQAASQADQEAAQAGEGGDGKTTNPARGVSGSGR
jgi:tetratricopeptide (TPR) repeat protein